MRAALVSIVVALLLGSVSAKEYFVGEARWFDDSAVDIEKRTLKMKVVNDSRFRPRAVSISSELGDCFSDLGVPEYLFRTNWNLFKVTRRGVESADEWCLISSSYRSFAIHIR